MSRGVISDTFKLRHYRLHTADAKIICFPSRKPTFPSFPAKSMSTHFPFHLNGIHLALFWLLPMDNTEEITA